MPTSSRNNMAPYWVVDRKASHDEDRQVMDPHKAVPFIWKYKSQIEPLLYRSAETHHHRNLGAALTGPREPRPSRPSARPRTTLYVAYRLNDPREIMPPQSPFAPTRSPGLTACLNFHRRRGRETSPSARAIWCSHRTIPGTITATRGASRRSTSAFLTFHWNRDAELDVFRA